MTKLIKTSLLKKLKGSSDIAKIIGSNSYCDRRYGNDIAKITARAKDYFDYRYNEATKNIGFKEIARIFLFSILMLITSVGFLIVKLTKGLILWPLWIIQHHMLKTKVRRTIIRDVQSDIDDIDDLNNKAQELENELKKWEKLLGVPEEKL